MKSGKLTWIAVLLVLAVLASTVELAAQDNRDDNHHKHVRYTLTDLGTLGGMFTLTTGLNNRGSVTGFSTLPGEMTADAFLWQTGVITDLSTLGGGPVSQGYAVNDRGKVSGFSYTSTPDPNGEDFCSIGYHLICLPFVWQKGVMTALPLLGGNNGFTGGINNRGQIVGVSETPNSDACSFAFLQVEAVIWQNGTVQEIPPFPGDAIGNATAINDKGQVVGVTGCVVTNTVRAVLWPKGPNGGVVDLGNLGGAGGNIAFGINNRGQVVGQSDLPGDTTHHAFLWENGVMTDLGTLYGLPVSLAGGINDKGQVVGFSQDLNSQNTVAFLWQDGVMTDLNQLIPPGSPLFLQEASAINNRGQIAAFGPLANGEQRGFLLTPCDDKHGDSEDCEGDENAVLQTSPSSRDLPSGTSPQSVVRRMNRYRLPGLGALPRN